MTKRLAIKTLIVAVGLAPTASSFTIQASSLTLSPCRYYAQHVNFLKDSSPSSSSSSSTALFANTKKKGANKKNIKKAKMGGGGGFGSAPLARTTGATESKSTRPSKQSSPLPQKDSDEIPKSKLPPLQQEISVETSRLTAIYTQEHQQQRENNNVTPNKSLLVQQISQSPLLYVIDDFIDPEACARVKSNGAGCFDLDFPERLSDLLFQGQASELDGLLFNQATSKEHGEKEIFPDGLHMDTNGQCLFRHVTAILYLNTIPEECGGATVFPLARTLPHDPALMASRRLLAENISHTRSRSVIAEPILNGCANIIESRGVGTNYDANKPDAETAIRIQPKAGRLLIFFSRDANGEEDPRAWHAGERLYDRVVGKKGSRFAESVATKKRILTLFKQVDYASAESVATTFETFLAPQVKEQRQWLQTKAQSSLS